MTVEGLDDITTYDLLTEVAAWVDANQHVRPAPDWFTTRELQARMPHLTLDRIRKTLDNGVERGEYEKVAHGRNVAYYHKVVR